MDARSKFALVVIAIALGVCETVPRAADNAAVETGPVLNLRLTTSSDLSRVSQRALVNEAEAIWRDANVRLRWITDNTGAETQRPLRILVTRRTVSASNTHSWPVGELLRFQDNSAIATASITSALRIIQGNPDRELLDLPAMHQYKLGVVLGRAVAHEIGHYLLESSWHARYGLMRATIDAREFADLRTGSFRLDRESQAHLAARTLALRGE
jgi:hypothetical protein